MMGYGRARNHSRDLGRCSSVGTSAGCGTGSCRRARRAIVAVPGGDNPNVSRCLVIHRRIDPSGSSTRRPSGRIVVGMKSEGHPVVHLDERNGEAAFTIGSVPSGQRQSGTACRHGDLRRFLDTGRTDRLLVDVAISQEPIGHACALAPSPSERGTQRANDPIVPPLAPSLVSTVAHASPADGVPGGSKVVEPPCGEMAAPLQQVGPARARITALEARHCRRVSRASLCSASTWAECGTARSSRARATRPGEAARRRASLRPTPTPGLAQAGR